MSFLGDLLGLGYIKPWRRLAKHLDGEFVDPPLTGGSYAVQVRSGDWIITLDLEMTQRARWTRMRAAFADTSGFQFSVRRHSLWTSIQRFFGVGEVEIGHVGFDRDFVIRGNSEVRLKRLLDQARIRQLMRQQPRLNLEVRGEGGLFDRPRFLPQGVALLRHREQGVVRDPVVLERLFELFAATLHAITFGADVDPDDLFTQMSRLRRPGGRYKDGHVLWEGDPARRDAAIRLGRLRDERAVPALTQALAYTVNRDLRLRILAIDALASIGSPKAVGPLVRLLGDPTVADGRPVNERAAEAITNLGEAEVAESVTLALAGEPERIRSASGLYRSEVIDACARALGESYAVHAARSLEMLHATEALPDLRAALRTWGPESEEGAALQTSIKELESQAGLPRPVSGADAEGLKTLPRPARGDDAVSDTLPRPARHAPDEPGKAVSTGVGEEPGPS